MTEYDARLADRVRTRGVLGADDAARLVLPVSESLAALHAAGAAHGAVSPAAVRVDADGRAWLVDNTEVAADPAYAAPDPSAGLRSDPRADDVWALAAVLLFVTTGEAPLDGVAPTPGRNGFRDVGWLAPLTELALAVDPRQRPTMEEMVAYLRARVPAPPRGRRPAGLRLGLAGAAVILGLAVLGTVLLLGGEDSSPDVGRPGPGTTTAVPPDPDEEGATSSPPAPTEVGAAELVRFARDYIETASRDPERGFRLLTRSYQDQSPRYREVWSAIEDPEILAVTPDPRAMTVSYTYRYSLPGGVRRTEDVTLRLVRADGQLLIAGASARQPPSR